MFRSPEGKVFNSRKLAVEYVEAQGGSAYMTPEELDKLRTGPKKRKRKENVWANGKKKKVKKLLSGGKLIILSLFKKLKFENVKTSILGLHRISGRKSGLFRDPVSGRENYFNK